MNTEWTTHTHTQTQNSRRENKQVKPITFFVYRNKMWYFYLITSFTYHYHTCITWSVKFPTFLFVLLPTARVYFHFVTEIQFSFHFLSFLMEIIFCLKHLIKCILNGKYCFTWIFAFDLSAELWSWKINLISIWTCKRKEPIYSLFLTISYETRCLYYW